MAVIVNNESSTQGDPTEEAIRQALSGMDLANVQDSTQASRYAVSSVDQGNVPTLVGAQIGGNTGTQGGQNLTVVGRDSVQVVTTANLVTVSLINDQGGTSPGNTYYYGTGPTGTKGFWTVPVTSVFGRTGSVVPAANDYAIGQLSLGTNVWVQCSATQNFVSGVGQIRAYDTIITDSLSEWNTVTYSFTAKNSGYYIVIANSYVPSNLSSPENVLVEVIVNSAAVSRIYQGTMPVAAGLAVASYGMTLLQLNAGDVLKFDLTLTGQNTTVGNFARIDFAKIFRIA